MRVLPSVVVSLVLVGVCLADDPKEKPLPAHVVYLVDVSGSMLNIFPDAKYAILQSLIALKPEQRFAVILITDNSPLMIGNGLMDRTKENIRTVVDELNKRQCRDSDNFPPALAAALKLQPDLIWYVSDGSIAEPARTIESFRKATIRSHTFTVNTIENFASTDEGSLETLKAIAEKTGGQCVKVQKLDDDEKPKDEKPKPATRPSGKSIFDK